MNPPALTTTVNGGEKFKEQMENIRNTAVKGIVVDVVGEIAVIWDRPHGLVRAEIRSAEYPSLRYEAGCFVNVMVLWEPSTLECRTRRYEFNYNAYQAELVPFDFLRDTADRMPKKVGSFVQCQAFISSRLPHSSGFFKSHDDFFGCVLCPNDVRLRNLVDAAVEGKTVECFVVFCNEYSPKWIVFAFADIDERNNGIWRKCENLPDVLDHALHFPFSTDNNNNKTGGRWHNRPRFDQRFGPPRDWAGPIIGESSPEPPPQTGSSSLDKNHHPLKTIRDALGVVVARGCSFCVLASRFGLAWHPESAALGIWMRLDLIERQSDFEGSPIPFSLLVGATETVLPTRVVPRLAELHAPTKNGYTMANTVLDQESGKEQDILVTAKLMDVPERCCLESEVLGQVLDPRDAIPLNEESSTGFLAEICLTRWGDRGENLVWTVAKYHGHTKTGIDKILLPVSVYPHNEGYTGSDAHDILTDREYTAPTATKQQSNQPEAMGTSEPSRTQRENDEWQQPPTPPPSNNRTQLQSLDKPGGGSKNSRLHLPMLGGGSGAGGEQEEKEQLLPSLSTPPPSHHRKLEENTTISEQQEQEQLEEVFSSINFRLQIPPESSSHQIATVVAENNSESVQSSSPPLLSSSPPLWSSEDDFGEDDNDNDDGLVTVPTKVAEGGNIYTGGGKQLNTSNNLRGESMISTQQQQTRGNNPQQGVIIANDDDEKPTHSQNPSHSSSGMTAAAVRCPRRPEHIRDWGDINVQLPHYRPNPVEKIRKTLALVLRKTDEYALAYAGQKIGILIAVPKHWSGYGMLDREDFDQLRAGHYIRVHYAETLENAHPYPLPLAYRHVILPPFLPVDPAQLEQLPRVELTAGQILRVKLELEISPDTVKEFPPRGMNVDDDDNGEILAPYKYIDDDFGRIKVDPGLKIRGTEGVVKASVLSIQEQHGCHWLLQTLGDSPSPEQLGFFHRVLREALPAPIDDE